ncbi:MAG: radical SAM protein [Leptospiraceae bacterium]|nr:radical SAM protein [Leptospiraceae bacterium]MDW8307327.1 radical SAM protein [Leptospiraceae bacterium]
MTSLCEELAEELGEKAQIERVENAILEKAFNRIRISDKEALFLWRHGNFRKMGDVAHQLRCQILPPNEVSYTVYRVVNYTNYCNVECTFCSFMDEVGSNKGYTLTVEQILQKLYEAEKLDSHQLFLQGGVNPELPFSYYIEVLQGVKKHFPHMHIRAFSPVEVIFMSRLTKLPLEEVFLTLKEAGMGSFPGAGAEILTERMRQILSPKKTTPQEWVLAMATAGKCGLPGSANIVWGSEEYDTEIITHLSLIRQLQDENKVLLSFVPWTFQAQTKKFRIRKVSSHEYLKMIALCRLYLDNIEHIEVSVMVVGKALAELALYFGADDINSPVIEENVLRSYGLKTVAEAEKFISEAGFTPVRRNFLYDRGKKT